MEMQTHTHRMGLNPFLMFYIDTVLNFDGDVDANADVTCEHTIKAHSHRAEANTKAKNIKEQSKNIKEIFFFLNFFLTHVHLWATDTHFRLLVTSPLGFKARVGSALFKLCGGVRDIRSLRFTSGATPLLVYIASIAAGRFPHMCVSPEVGCRI